MLHGAFTVCARGIFWGALCAMTLHPVAAIPASTEPASVQVFTTAQLPTLRRLDRATQVWVLDSIETPLNALSFPYPGNEDAARRQAVSLINSPRGRAVLAQLRRTAQAVALAWQSGIEKLPAVLIDHHYVVYGDYDVQVAVERVALFKADAIREETDLKKQVHAPSVERVRQALATEMSATYAQ